MAISSTSFRSKWRNSPTTVIRVPAALAPTVVEYARSLDEKSGVSMIREAAAAYRTASEVSRTSPVNVASVPQRSPFRYPGGKTWLVPYVRTWLRSSPTHPKTLVEPFAGGGIVSLTAVMEGLVEQAILVEKDPSVAAVWKTIAIGEGEWLAERIRRFDLSKRSVAEVLESKPIALRDRAFATILRNRVQRGGIMAPGAGLVKEGEAGKGLASRWYPETLARRLIEIDQIRDRLLVIEGDGFEIIRDLTDLPDTAFFVDPPYTVASKRLYSHWQVDHRELFSLLRDVHGDILLTYDNTREVAELASEFRFETAAVAMKNTHHAKMDELLIGKSLRWLTVAESSRESPSRSRPETLAFRP